MDKVIFLEDYNAGPAATYNFNKETEEFEAKALGYDNIIPKDTVIKHEADGKLGYTYRQDGEYPWIITFTDRIMRRFVNEGKVKILENDTEV
jgi:hypothetical protein